MLNGLTPSFFGGGLSVAAAILPWSTVVRG
jgi:hypothetical protein